MEQLIRDFNAPENQGDPEKINHIQRQIQKLQREHSAWDLGLSLLNHTEDVMRFYGALTIGIKVNNDWEKDKVGEDRAIVSQLLERLVTSYVSIAQTTESDFVLIKLASTLAAVFGKPTCAWALPARHILACVVAGRYINQTDVSTLDAILSSDASISCSTARSLFLLVTALQEEINSTKANSENHHAQIHLSNNTTDVWILVDWALSCFTTHALRIRVPELPYKLQLDGTPTQFDALTKHVFLAVPLWASHLTEAESGSQKIASAAFKRTVEVLVEALMAEKLVIEVLTILTTLQEEDHRLLLSTMPDLVARVVESDCAKKAVQTLKTGDENDEAKAYVDFIDATINQVDTTNPDYLRRPELVSALRQTSELLHCGGIAAVEDTICRPMLDIIMTVTEGFSDWPSASEFDDDMRNLVRESCAAVLTKIRYPTDELEKSTQTWDDDDRLMFEDFRFDVQDFLQTAYGVLGPVLLLDMVAILQALDPVSTNSRSVLEGVIFALTALADATADDADRCDPCLDEIFATPVWKIYLSSEDLPPSRVTQALINFLGEITTYLERHPRQMLDSLNLLFTSLQVKGLSTVASKAIQSLCDGGRSSLTEGLPQFINSLRVNSNLIGDSKYRVFGAVSSVVQALATEIDKIEPLKAILEIAWNTRAAESSENEANVETAKSLDLVRMLAAICRGLQTPNDAVVDLESSVAVPEQSIWLDGAGAPVQMTVLELFRGAWSSSSRPPSAEMVEASCEFLRCGFTEDHPSALKFPDSVSVDLLISMLTLENTSLERVMSIASAFLAGGHSRGKKEAFAKLVDHILQLCQRTMSNEPNGTLPNDALACASAIDFFGRLLPNWGLDLMLLANGPEKVGFILEYALVLLGDGDMLPRRWAASFYSVFVENFSAGSRIASDDKISSSVTDLLDLYLPRLLILLVKLLAGECARSEIEILTETLRKCVIKQPLRTKHILQKAVKAESSVLPPTAIEATKPEQRTRFVAQVDSLRGARKTNDITRQFWLACKGDGFGYIT